MTAAFIRIGEMVTLGNLGSEAPEQPLDRPMLKIRPQPPAKDRVEKAESRSEAVWRTCGWAP